jgi:VanZ family protein
MMPALPIDDAPHPPTASTTTRVIAMLYVLLVFYASCYPFSGWHNLGVSPFAYLGAPLPRYRTVFDLVTNVAAYIPLGILLVMALYPAVKKYAAILLAVALGALLSASLEAVQTFLPSRVPSNLDLFANTAGTVIGALLGPLATHHTLERGYFLPLRRRWFSSEASRGLAILALWPLAQIYPQAYLFGHGHFTPVLSNWLSYWLAQPVELSLLLKTGITLNAEHYWVLEAIITACGLSGTLLALLCLLRSKSPKLLLIAVLLLAAFAINSLSSALLFAPHDAFAWLTPGAKSGILLGIAIVLCFYYSHSTTQRRFAAFALSISLLVVNAAPINPYFSATLQTWVQGQFLNFNGAAHFLSLTWPLFTLWFLLHPVHRSKPH